MLLSGQYGVCCSQRWSMGSFTERTTRSSASIDVPPKQVRYCPAEGFLSRCPPAISLTLAMLLLGKAMPTAAA